MEQFQLCNAAVKHIIGGQMEKQTTNTIECVVRQQKCNYVHQILRECHETTAMLNVY